MAHGGLLFRSALVARLFCVTRFRSNWLPGDDWLGAAKPLANLAVFYQRAFDFSQLIFADISLPHSHVSSLVCAVLWNRCICNNLHYAACNSSAFLHHSRSDTRQL